MELIATGTDESGAPSATDSLQAWLLQTEGLSAEVDRRPGVRRSDDMGFEVLLSIVLAAPAVVELVKSVHTWLTTRVNKTEVTFSEPGGRTITISTESLEDLSAHLEAAAVLAS